MRKKLESLEKLGQFKIKLVERAGNKIVDVLHKSDAWSMMDCEREDCLICKTETSNKGTCRRRNVLYETFCITCKNEREEVILEEENQSKNLSIVQMPDGTEEANDTPVFVEVEGKSEERVLEWENQAKTQRMEKWK